MTTHAIKGSIVEVSEHDRKFGGWLTVEVKDRQGDILPISRIKELGQRNSKAVNKRSGSRRRDGPKVVLDNTILSIFGRLKRYHVLESLLSGTEVAVPKQVLETIRKT